MPQTMPWFILALVFVVVFSWLVTRVGRIAPAHARRLLAEGARVLDVRSAVEFASSPLPGALNVPLDVLGTRLAVLVPDRNTPLLLHCQSGGRSGIATKLVQRMGYRRAFNLGSLQQARAIVVGSGTAGLDTTSPR